MNKSIRLAIFSIAVALLGSYGYTLASKETSQRELLRRLFILQKEEARAGHPESQALAQEVAEAEVELLGAGDKVSREDLDNAISGLRRIRPLVTGQVESEQIDREIKILLQAR